MELILLMIGGIVFIVIMFFFIGIYIATKVSKVNSKRKMAQIYEASSFREKKAKPSDDFKARDERKEIVTGKVQSEQYQKYTRLNEATVEIEKDTASKDEAVIVDFVKPVGFWSKLIMSQKMGFLIAMRHQMSRKNKQGYFVNLIHAQSRSQSKEKGRGF